MKVNRNIRKNIIRNNLKLEDATMESVLNLKKQIKDKLIDPRQHSKIIYKVWDIVITVFLGILCNCNDWDDVEVFAKSNYSTLRRYLKMTGGIPCSKTYENVMSCLDKTTLESICLFFLTDIIKLKKKKMRDVLNIDGKIDRGSSRLQYNSETEEYEKIKHLNVLNVYSNKLGACIASEMIEDKTNEITSFPTIIERLNIRNKIITVDALNTQKENCILVKKKRGDYIFALKGNQGTFYEDVKLYFNDTKLKELKENATSYISEYETRGKTSIHYEYFQTEDIEWYYDHKGWKGLKSIGMVQKTISEPGKDDVIETRYYISSLPLSIILFSTAIRLHWSVENKLHWQLDYTFKQDSNTTTDKDALLGLQVLKKLALALLNPIREKEKISMNKLRLRNSFNVDYELNKIFKFFA